MATHIEFNDQLPHGRLLRRGMNNLEEGHETINDVINTMALMLNGDGSEAAHFNYVKDKFGFTSDAAAKSAYEELNSFAAKLNTDSSVSGVHAALLQAFNKFR